MKQLINDFLNIYSKLENKKVWIVEEIPITTKIKIDNGYDHLGPLPPTLVTQIIDYDYTEKSIYINKFTIELFVENLLKNNVFLSYEDAYWTARLRKQNKERNNKKC